jgi:GTP-binding protein HflX
MKKMYSIEDETKKERILLITVSRNPKERWEKFDGLEEMASLAETAGCEVVEQMVQNRKTYDTATFIGKGKAKELKKIVQDLTIDTVIFNEELTPSQKRKIEDIVDRKILDRRELILDIFAQHAKTETARIEVELAQLRFRFHMLQGAGIELSRLGGGIGTRGPGEQRLEVDRRRIRSKITHYEKKLDRIEKSHKIQTKRRKGIFRVAMVGYTNAGKSTLMNALSDANVLVEDKLFATLDAITRLVEIDPLHRFLITDTVGFIKNLPPQLIASFHATLDEAIEADVRLHLVDASYENINRHMEATRKIMSKLGIEEKKTIVVFNKIDLVPTVEIIERLLRKYPDSVAISAKNNAGIKGLLQKIQEMMDGKTVIINICISSVEGKVQAWVRERAYVIEERNVDHEVHLTVRMNKADVAKLRKKMKEGDIIERTVREN